MGRITSLKKLITKKYSYLFIYIYIKYYTCLEIKINRAADEKCKRNLHKFIRHCAFSDKAPLFRNRFIELQRQSTRFICMFTRMTLLFYKVIALQIIKSSLL